MINCDGEDTAGTILHPIILVIITNVSFDQKRYIYLC